jgi:D-inositol-3-phosphate glycosyltransferase
LIAVCHNIIPHEKRIGDKILSKYFLEKMDYFIPLSDQVKKDLFLFLKNPVYKLLPLPVFSRFGEKVDKQEAKKYLKLTDEKILLFFGFIRDYKGLDVLIEAISLVKKKLHIKLIVAGEFYESEERYLKLITSYNLERKIILFKDFIPTDQMLSIISRHQMQLCFHISLQHKVELFRWQLISVCLLLQQMLVELVK